MGNQSSRGSRSNIYSSQQHDYISSPKVLSGKSDCKDEDLYATGGNVHRSSSHYGVLQGSSSNSRLGVPSGHRRAVSVSARPPTNQTNRESLAPPTYEAAISQPSASSNTLTVPQANTRHAHRNSWSSGSRLSANAYANAPQEFRSSGDVSTMSRAEYLRRPMRQSSVEDALETLKKYNTVIVVDDSGSMMGHRWDEAREALASLAEIASKYDTDGVDICFLNDRRTGTDMTDPNAIRRLFNSVRPHGPTPIGERLEELLLFYISNLEDAKQHAHAAGDISILHAVKPINYIVITDGAATDDPESVIVTAAKRLDNHNFPLTQVGIQFVQIGDDYKATEFLDELDNGLGKYGVRDMVDTTPYLGGRLNAEMIIKILLGGINRRVDKKGGNSVI